MVKTYCGLISIIGRPNVGKSTLLNALVEKKVSITSHKPQTTRHTILGIKTHKNIQMVFVDTPGIQRKLKTAIHRYMNRTALSVLNDVDLILFMIDSETTWTEGEEWILKAIKDVSTPVILVLNKVDKVKDKEKILMLIKTLEKKFSWDDIVPLSAKKHDNVERLSKLLVKKIPENSFLFSPEQTTDRPERFQASEIIREKIIRYLGQELPYSTSIEIEQFKDEKKMIRISAVIWAEKQSQKPIIIGKKGESLKMIGQSARVALEKHFGKKVFLQLWVKIKKGWSEDKEALKSLGYY